VYAVFRSLYTPSGLTYRFCGAGSRPEAPNEARKLQNMLPASTGAGTTHPLRRKVFSRARASGPAAHLARGARREIFTLCTSYLSRSTTRMRSGRPPKLTLPPGCQRCRREPQCEPPSHPLAREARQENFDSPRSSRCAAPTSRRSRPRPRRGR